MTGDWRAILPVVVLSVVSVSAQERPDFTGTWQEDTGSSTSVNIETILQQGPITGGDHGFMGFQQQPC